MTRIDTQRSRSTEQRRSSQWPSVKSLLTLGVGVAVGATLSRIGTPITQLPSLPLPLNPAPAVPASRSTAWIAATPHTEAVPPITTSGASLDTQLPSDSLQMHPPYAQALERTQRLELGKMPAGTRTIANLQHAVLKHPTKIGPQDSVVIFCMHTADGQITPHARHYVKHLARHYTHVIASIATDAEVDRVQLPEDFMAQFSGVLVRENFGIDFAGWAKAMRVWPSVWDGAELTLTNDSNFGPVRPSDFTAVVQRVSSSPSDYIGLLESVQGLEPLCVGPGESTPTRHHFQSYFLAFKNEALTNDALQSFWYREVFGLADKNDAIRRYELTMTARAQAGGLRTEALFSQLAETGCQNPSHQSAAALLAKGYPFVKRDIFLKPEVRAVRDTLDLEALQRDYAVELPLD